MEKEAIAILWDIYVKEIRSKKYEVGSTKSEKRQYRKADAEYWTKKAARKEKTKARKEKIARNNRLLARGSVIGSAVYRTLPVEKRKQWMRREIISQAMGLIKSDSELTDEEVREFLENNWQLAVGNKQS